MALRRSQEGRLLMGRALLACLPGQLPCDGRVRVLTTVVPTHRRCVVNIQRSGPYSHIELGLLYPRRP